MGLKGLTVNRPPEEEPQIYAEDDAAVFQSIFGGDGVSSIGQRCKATILSNNKVRIADGVICLGGHFARIPYGDYEDCEIANGQSGKKRNDIIIGKFKTTGLGGVDTMTCEVKEGVAGVTATDPALTQDDLYQGGKIREIPLYRVKIEGLSIVAVEPLFQLLPTNEELRETITELNSKLTNKYISILESQSGTSYTHNIATNRDIREFDLLLFETPYGVIQAFKVNGSWKTTQLTYFTGGTWYAITSEVKNISSSGKSFTLSTAKWQSASANTGVEVTNVYGVRF